MSRLHRRLPQRRLRVASALLALALAVLALAGCAAPSTPASTSGATPMTVEAGVQRITIMADGAFSPSLISAKAGIPIELSFGQGSGCSAAIKFPPLGIEQDLSTGPATVTLPALEPGRYTMYCQSNMDMGTLIVE